MADESIQLRDQVGVLRRRWRVLAVTVALALTVGTLLVALLPKTYVAATELRLLDDPLTSDALTEEEVATEARAVTSYDAVTRTIATLGLQESPEQLLDSVTVTPDETGAAVLSIAVSRGSPSEAADIANTLAGTYLDATGERALDRLTELETRIDEINATIGRLDQEMQDAGSPQAFTELQFERRRARAERALLANARSSIVLNQGIESQTGEVVTPAFAPSTPASPKPVRTLGLALAVGLMLGAGFAYLREYFDDVVRYEGNLTKTLSGLAVLGRIPHLRRRDRREPTTLTSPGTPASESYRALTANVRHLLSSRMTAAAPPGANGHERRPGQIVVVSSASAAEGRTATAINLAVVAARAGIQTILIDAELRQPHVGTLLELPPGPGLADVLAGTAPAKDALVNGRVDNLAVMPAGDAPANPAELLSSPRLARLLTNVAERADLVVVDSPPVLAAADTLEMARRADMTVLAVREDVSRCRNVTEAVDRLRQVGATVAGVVLVDVNRRRRSISRASL